MEVHEEWWWRNRLEAQGFRYAIDLTQIARQQATNAAESETDAQHLRHRLLVFINPKVAALPKHHHLFGGHGCFGSVIDNRDGGMPCMGTEDILPERYQSLMNCSRFVDVNKFKTKEEKGSAWQKAIWNCKSRDEMLSSSESPLKSKYNPGLTTTTATTSTFESNSADIQESLDGNSEFDSSSRSRGRKDRGGGRGGNGRARKRKKMINSV